MGKDEVVRKTTRLPRAGRQTDLSGYKPGDFEASGLPWGEKIIVFHASRSEPDTYYYSEDGLTDAIADHTAGDVYLLPGGTLGLTSSVIVPDNITIIGQGRYTIITGEITSLFESPGQETTASNVRFEDLSFVRDYTGGKDYGCILYNFDHLTVKNCYFEGYENPILFYDSAYHVHVIDCEFDHCSDLSGNAIATSYDHTDSGNQFGDFRITGCKFVDTPLAIWMYGNEFLAYDNAGDVGFHDVVIEENTFYFNSDLSDTSVTAGYIEGLSISNNTFYNSDNMIYTVGIRDAVIEGNAGTDIRGGGIYIETDVQLRNISITGNAIHGKDGGNELEGIYVNGWITGFAGETDLPDSRDDQTYAWAGISITGNTVDNCDYWAISVQDAANVLIADNTITRSEAEGIAVYYDCWNIHVVNNQIRKTDDYEGIYVQGENMVVSGNIVQESAEEGIWCYVNNSIIANNIVYDAGQETDNTYACLRVTTNYGTCGDNLIIGNHLRNTSRPANDPKYGLYLQDCSCHVIANDWRGSGQTADFYDANKDTSNPSMVFELNGDKFRFGSEAGGYTEIDWQGQIAGVTTTGTREPLMTSGEMVTTSGDVIMA